MAFSNEAILQVWAKGSVVGTNDPAIWRKDQCDAWMQFSKYGNRNSDYGWEVDHISPGNDDDLLNLRPLHWANNVRKSDGRLSCPVTAQGTQNVRGSR